eukprot:scaffold8233_cov229-Pinguiococcus_pyrenoidosus.AAC.1
MGRLNALEAPITSLPQPFAPVFTPAMGLMGAQGILTDGPADEGKGSGRRANRMPLPRVGQPARIELGGNCRSERSVERGAFCCAGLREGYRSYQPLPWTGPGAAIPVCAGAGSAV